MPLMTKDEEKRTRIMQMRLQGQTYQQIANAIGISRQRVAVIISPPKEIRDYVVAKANGLCQKCGITVGRSGHIHHVDSSDENYNELDNLQLLCPSCHRSIHNNQTLLATIERGFPLSDSHDLLTIAELAKYLKVDPNTVYIWVRTGKLKSYQLGGHLHRISRDQIETARKLAQQNSR